MRGTAWGDTGLGVPVSAGPGVPVPPGSAPRAGLTTRSESGALKLLL